MSPSSPVLVGAALDGSVTYLVDLAPEALPPVGRRDLEAAWEAARGAAIAGHWGVVRGFRFRRQDGTQTQIALTDCDAGCWAEAVDRTVGMHTAYGLSLCLRLLALVDLLARAPWARKLIRITRADAAELHPSLLMVAGTTPVTSEGRFDAALFRARLAELTGCGDTSVAGPIEPRQLTGAPA